MHARAAPAGGIEGPRDTLTFSIIIPTYRRPAQLRACLESVAELEYPRDRFEVLVVNDGTDLPPADVVRALSHRINVRLLTQPHGGPASARNTGAAMARGTFLAFTDDDCTPSPSWLMAFAEILASAPGCGIGGRTVNTLIDNPYSTASQTLIGYLYSRFDPAQDGAFFPSNNLCVPADRFRAIGGFDARFTTAEDRDFCGRWLHRGYRLLPAPRAIVSHAHSLTFVTFCRQHFNYGRGAPPFRRACKLRHVARSTSTPRPVRPAPGLVTFYADLLRHPYLHTTPGRAFRTSTLLALSQLAYTGGVVWEQSIRSLKLAGRQLALRDRSGRLQRP